MSTEIDVDDAEVTQQLLLGLAIAIRYATANAVTAGDAAGDAVVFSRSPMRLSHGRGTFGFGGHWEQGVTGRHGDGAQSPHHLVRRRRRVTGQASRGPD